MRAFINKIFSKIGESIYDKKGGKVSSTRMASYFILGAILFAAFVFVGIDIVNACVAIYNKGFYEIPANHIVLYGMTLAHHLTLLGINKNAEKKVEVAVQEKLKAINDMNNKGSAAPAETTPPVEPTPPEEPPADAEML